jgi:hypothetical protein
VQDLSADRKPKRFGIFLRWRENETISSSRVHLILMSGNRFGRPCRICRTGDDYEDERADSISVRHRGLARTLQAQTHLIQNR